MDLALQAPAATPGVIADILIDDPKIHIEEHFHEHPATGQLLRVLVLHAPLGRWRRVPAAIQARWIPSQVNARQVQAHRVIFC